MICVFVFLAVGVCWIWFAMSQATKRKHVVKEVLGDFVAPTESQQIVKVGDDFIEHTISRRPTTL